MEEFCKNRIINGMTVQIIFVIMYVNPSRLKIVQSQFTVSSTKNKVAKVLIIKESRCSTPSRDASEEMMSGNWKE